MPAATPAQQRAEMIERARQDLEDISALRKTNGFGRYWLRRLKQKRDEVHFTFLNEDSVTKDDREVLRKTVKFCDELLKMMDADEAAATATYGNGV